MCYAYRLHRRYSYRPGVMARPERTVYLCPASAIVGFGLCVAWSCFTWPCPMSRSIQQPFPFQCQFQFPSHIRAWLCPALFWPGLCGSNRVYFWPDTAVIRSGPSLPDVDPTAALPWLRPFMYWLGLRGIAPGQFRPDVGSVFCACWPDLTSKCKPAGSGWPEPVRELFSSVDGQFIARLFLALLYSVGLQVHVEV